MTNILIATQNEISDFINTITGKKEKALKDIVFHVAGCLVMSDISADEYIQSYLKNEIFDASVLLQDGAKLTDGFSSKFEEFGIELFSHRSIGIGTPNAACGEGELMAIVCSPNVKILKKKNQGDILVHGKKVELKGKDIRVFSKISGKKFHELSLMIAKKHNVIPNKSTIKVAQFVNGSIEPWIEGKKDKNQKSIGDFWREQFKQIGTPAAVDFLFELMNATGSAFNKKDIELCFTDNVYFSNLILQRLIIKAFFNNTPRVWDSLTIIKNNIVRTITSDAEFEKHINEGRIIPKGSFIRLNQDLPIGWYFDFI